MQETYIYGLYDPREPEKIMYVGKSIRPKERLRDHCNPTKSIHANAWLHCWIKKLLLGGVAPAMTIIESFSDADWKNREVFWIAHYRALNTDLLNIQRGGNGAGIIEDETRRRLSISGTGRKHSEDTKKLQSNSALARPSDSWDYLRGDGNPAKRPEVREKLKQAQLGEKHPRGFLGKHHTAEVRARMCASQNRPEIKAATSCKGKPKSEEMKRKLRATWNYRKALALRQSTAFGWEDVIAV